MFARSLILVLFWAVICASVSAAQTGALADPMRPYSQTNSGVDSLPSYRVSGTFISASGRVAIFNGKPAREGDRVDGAEILSIGANAVRIRTGSRELTVYLGSGGVRGRSSDSTMQISRGPAARTIEIPRRRTDRMLEIGREPGSTPAPPEPTLAATPAPSQAPTVSRSDTHGRHGPVKRGETLSGIARHYLTDGVTMNQMMSALFQANPQAFSGNINVLHEGAVLRIPDGKELSNRPPETATAEVSRQQIDWRRGKQQHARLTEVQGDERYGPVRRGETLSDIAQRYLSHGVTMNQMTIALFKANPQAFSDNINVLYEGAILRIPNGDELRRRSPETATAEVLRQTDVWRIGSGQQVRLITVAITNTCWRDTMYL